MSDQTKKGRWSPFSVMLTVIVLLVLYVLSIGPAFRICLMAGLDLDHPIIAIMAYFYFPLDFIRDRSDFVNSAMNWYIAWWLS